MDVAALHALALDAALEAFGVSATVTPPEEASIETTAIWVRPLAEDFPIGRDLQRREPRRILALPRADVPSVPRGTRIVAAEAGTTTARTWQVDGIDRTEADRFHVIVVPVPE